MGGSGAQIIATDSFFDLEKVLSGMELRLSSPSLSLELWQFSSRAGGRAGENVPAATTATQRSAQEQGAGLSRSCIVSDHEQKQPGDSV